MDTNYEIGKFYDLAFKNIVTLSDGRQYIVATDGPQDFTIRPFEFQVDYDAIPQTIPCYLSKIGFSGRPNFEQSREFVLQDRYIPGKLHKFTVDEIHIDANTKKTFYVLSDEFGITHRYYPKDEETLLKSGDTITLFVNRIVPAQNGKNNARLDLEAKVLKAERVYTTASEPVYPKGSGKKNFGTENDKKEFKSSIVYPAGKTIPDIKAQLAIICRTIAGFMNANGGTLYIGVSDNGYVCGIESDYGHLNDDEAEPSYKENDDQYMRKITDRICEALGRTAGTLINMRIEEADGLKYCVVDIKKASRPIWFDGNKLYVRVVTTNRLFKGDEITQYVLDRTSKISFSKQKEEEKPIEDSYSSEPEQANIAATVIKPKPIITKKATTAWRNITFYDNGEWSFQKDELQGVDVVCNAVVPCDAKQNRLVLIIAYENGHVEATELKEVLYGKKGLNPEGKRRKQGLCLKNGKIVSAFCVKRKDMLLLTSEVAGEKYVKALDVDTLGIHDKMGMGNEIIREVGATLIGALHIPDDPGSRIALKGSGIFIEKNQKYTKGGVKLASLASNYREMLNNLTLVNSPDPKVAS